MISILILVSSGLLLYWLLKPPATLSETHMDANTQEPVKVNRIQTHPLKIKYPDRKIIVIRYQFTKKKVRVMAKTHD